MKCARVCWSELMQQYYAVDVENDSEQGANKNHQ